MRIAHRGLFFLRLYVQHQAVIGDLVAMIVGDLALQTLDLVTDEFDHLAGLDVHHVVMMMALGQLEHRMAALEMVARDQRGGFELGEHPIDRRQANVFAGVQQMAINFLRAEVARITRLKNLEDLEAWQCDLESGLAQVLVFHRCLRYVRAAPACAGRALGVLLHAENSRPNVMTHFRILLLLCLLAGLSACAVFRLPTVQGNVIDQKQVDQLEIGMTPDQVRFLLGSPLVQGSFDPNRWDYVYYYRSPRGEEIKRSLNLYFVEGRLSNMVGQTPPDAATDKKASDETAPVEAKQVDNTPLPDSGAGPAAEQQDDSPISKP